MNNKDVQGSANVSRNVNVGGTASVCGSVLVSHHLVVKGWVDAPHVKGPMKGLYASETALRAAYPRPDPGWFALVGATLPAAVWRSQSGSWQPTGAEGGEFTIWLDEIESALDRDREEITDITERLSAHDTTLSGYGTRITRIENELARDVIHWSDRGASEGVAPLDEAGIVPERNLPDVLYRREVGALEGVAPLDDEGKVPERHLRVTEIFDKQLWDWVGKPEGIAPLDETAKVPEVNLPVQEIFDKQVWNLAGKPDGVVLLDDEGQVPSVHLRGVVMRSEMGQPGGVAPLMAAGTEGEGTVPLRHLPSAVMNSVITLTIGKADGIASLDAEAHVPMEQLAPGRMMVRVDSEEEMEALIESGEWNEDKIYYTVEE